MKITDIQRAAWVKRWGIVRTMREQNIAEHSFMVAMIAEEICNRIGWEFNEGGAMHGMRGYEVLRWALWHDLAEVFTGDIPTPMKLKIKESNPELLQQIEDEFAPEVKALRERTNPMWVDIVKIADYVEAIAFLDREAGNKEAVAVKELLTHQMMSELSKQNASLARYRGTIIDIVRDMGIEV